MFFTIHFDKKRIIEYCICMALAVGIFVSASFTWQILAGFGILLFALCFLKLTLPRVAWMEPVWTVLLLIAGPVFTTLCVQHVILDAELFEKTSRAALILNMSCIAVVYLALLCLTASVRISWSISHLFFLLVAFVDYYVYEFRQNELTFSDLRTIRTGLNVAKSYQIRLNDRGGIILLLSLLAVLFVWKCNLHFEKRLSRMILRGTSFAAAAALVLGLPVGFSGRVTHTWEKKGSYRNGFVANFILGFEDSFVDKPETYSKDTIMQIEQEYLDKTARGSGEDEAAQNLPQASLEEDYTNKTGAEEPQETEKLKTGISEEQAEKQPGTQEPSLPTIITIMDESFADFRAVGNLRTNTDVMPFIDSLEENTVKGFALASVYGAKTPNSEWEYLTGHSMAFLPSGSVAYEQYMDSRPYSLVSELLELGYTTIAMHPYNQSGWKRNTVYPKLGFSEQYFLEDGFFDETKIYREYITDQEMFEKLIGRYEQKQPGEPLFILGVTMQNHGGYTERYDNFRNEIYVRGSFYADANQYLSLIHKTDQAVRYLVTYFSQVDEPVVIVFFGDHLPSLSNGFYKTLNGRGISGLTLTALENLFKVPFFIWTNYDSPERTVEITSLNYLSTLTLEQAGISLTPYHQFLKDLMEVVPAVNSKGYYSSQEGKFLHLEDAQDKDEEWLEKYHVLQYNAMFDQKNRSEYFFPYFGDMLQQESEETEEPDQGDTQS